ncbi:MAG: hypothetical protein AB8G77_03315 [Rhodothermales bacterium]
MLKSYLSFGTLFVACLLVGCSGSGGASSSVDNTVRENLGAFPRINIVSTTDEALQIRYGYSFTRRVETGEDIYFETEWKDVITFDDEREQGVDFVRVRIFLTARPRNRSAGSLASYATTFRAEVLQRVNMTGVWTEKDMSPERKEYIKEIANYMETELRTQFRN